jgi:hypothetical protein
MLAHRGGSPPASYFSPLFVDDSYRDVTDGPRHELAAERDREHRRRPPSDRVDIQRRQRAGVTVDPVRS